MESLAKMRVLSICPERTHQRAGALGAGRRARRSPAGGRAAAFRGTGLELHGQGHSSVLSLIKDAFD